MITRGSQWGKSSKRVTVNRPKHNIITVNRQITKEKIWIVMEKITAFYEELQPNLLLSATPQPYMRKIELRLKKSCSNQDYFTTGILILTPLALFLRIQTKR